MINGSEKTNLGGITRIAVRNCYLKLEIAFGIRRLFWPSNLSVEDIEHIFKRPSRDSRWRISLEKLQLATHPR